MFSHHAPTPSCPGLSSRTSAPAGVLAAQAVPRHTGGRPGGAPWVALRLRKVCRAPRTGQRQQLQIRPSHWSWRCIPGPLRSARGGRSGSSYRRAGAAQYDQQVAGISFQQTGGREYLIGGQGRQAAPFRCSQPQVPPQRWCWCQGGPEKGQLKGVAYKERHRCREVGSAQGSQLYRGEREVHEWATPALVSRPASTCRHCRCARLALSSTLALPLPPLQPATLRPMPHPVGATAGLPAVAHQVAAAAAP